MQLASRSTLDKHLILLPQQLEILVVGILEIFRENLWERKEEE